MRWHGKGQIENFLSACPSTPNLPILTDFFIYVYMLFTEVDNHHLRNTRLKLVQLFHIAMQIRICTC